MHDQRSLGATARDVLGALEELDGEASPGELREWTGLPARTLSHALGRLDEAGWLAERSKARVRLLNAAPTHVPPATSVDSERTVFRARTAHPEPATDETVDARAAEAPVEARRDGGGGFWDGLLQGLGSG